MKKFGNIIVLNIIKDIIDFDWHEKCIGLIMMFEWVYTISTRNSILIVGGYWKFFKFLNRFLNNWKKCQLRLRIKPGTV